MASLFDAEVLQSNNAWLPPSQTIVLVRPDQYLDTVNSPSLRSRTLKRYNVVIASLTTTGNVESVEVARDQSHQFLVKFFRD